MSLLTNVKHNLVTMAKQYGLIKPETTKLQKRPAIFNSDSDSNDGSEKPTGITVLKKKERLAQQKALTEDPTIYQYDELYEDMQSKRKESKLARKDLDKQPKYINKLLETAERRKRENERRIERQVQKEREEEGDMYKDKESYVTSAYRKKLEEIKELDEKDKHEEYLESIGDVKKQSDLSGFYRHLYAQQVNFEEETAKTSEPSKTNEKIEVKETKKRKYRKRETSESDTEDKKPILEHLPSNLDADSDFSIDSESENSENESESKKSEEKEIKKEENELQEKTVQETEEKPNKELIEAKLEIVEKVKKPKIDIWKKRTVGEAFDDALKRFYERKAAKIQSVA